jgi:hypothetical protein
MSFGNKLNKNKVDQVYNRFSFKIKVKDIPSPIFEVSKLDPTDNKYKVLDKPATVVTGSLYAVKPTDTKWNGKTISSVNLTLRDGDDIYFVTVPWSNIGRGLLNSILNLKEFNDVSISLWLPKPRKEGEKTYPTATVRQNDIIVKWKFSGDALPKAKTITFKDQIMRDYTETDLFLKKQLVELDKLIKSSLESSSTAPEVVSTDSIAAQESQEENMPF